MQPAPTSSRLGFQPDGVYMRVMQVSAEPAVHFRNPGPVIVAPDPDGRVAALYIAHFRQLVGLATMLSGGRAEGEEIAQEAFVTALQHERLAPGYLRDPVWPWLRITAVRLAGRNRRRLLHEALLYRLRGVNAETSDAWEVETLDLVRALRRLPARMRLCVILSHVEDQSTIAIAAMLGCSTQNVDAQLRKGRARLRALLGERYIESEGR
jgi:RNA polymerase sigma factor (sigma-70 family)